MSSHCPLTWGKPRARLLSLKAPSLSPGPREKACLSLCGSTAEASHAPLSRRLVPDFSVEAPLCFYCHNAPRGPCPGRNPGLSQQTSKGRSTQTPPSRVPPGFRDPSPGFWAPGRFSPQSLRPLLAPQPRTSGPLGPGAPGPPQCRACWPRRQRPGPEPRRRGQPRWGRPGCSGGPSGSVPPPPRGAATSARSPAAAAARTGRGEAPAEAAAPRPLRARPPALAGRRAAPAPAPPPPPHPAPARPPLPLLTVSVGRAGGERPGRAGDGACAEAATAATATAAARPSFNTSGRRRRPAGALKGTRPYCGPRGE